MKPPATNGLGVRRENTAVVICHPGWPQVIEIRLDNGVGRRPQHGKLLAPSQNITTHRPVSCLSIDAPLLANMVEGGRTPIVCTEN
jgi:hypothetical protein